MAFGRLIVVAVALQAVNGTILIQQRPADKQHGGLWEFPGGKCEPGEDARAALSRELAEELGIGVRAEDLSPLSFSVMPRGDGELLLLLFRCTRWQGDPVPHAAIGLRWVAPEDLAQWPMPPADVPLAEALSRMAGL